VVNTERSVAALLLERAQPAPDRGRGSVEPVSDRSVSRPGSLQPQRCADHLGTVGSAP
jgi:hypothetical protein